MLNMLISRNAVLESDGGLTLFITEIPGEFQ